MKNIELEELKNKIEKHEVTLVEVLKKDDYDQSHIKGAVHLYEKDIGEGIKERFLKQEPLVVYCSDPSCTSSLEAAKKLENLGFENISRFAGGKKEWRDAGLPLISS